MVNVGWQNGTTTTTSKLLLLLLPLHYYYTSTTPVGEENQSTEIGLNSPVLYIVLRREIVMKDTMPIFPRLL
jgi:hypothetical protein